MALTSSPPASPPARLRNRQTAALTSSPPARAPARPRARPTDISTGSPFAHSPAEQTAVSTSPPPADPETPPPPPLALQSSPRSATPPSPKRVIPNSINVRIQRDVVWFKNLYLASLKSQPPKPRQALRQATVKINKNDEGDSLADDLRLAVDGVVYKVVDDTVNLAKRAGIPGTVIYSHCTIRGAAIRANGRKIDDIFVDTVNALSSGGLGYPDFDRILDDFLAYTSRAELTFGLYFEYEFEIQPPTPAPAAPVPPVSTALGTPYSQLLSAQAAAMPTTTPAPAPTTGSKKRKSTTNTMLAELEARNEAAVQQQASTGILEPRLLYADLSARWACRIGSKCPHYRGQAINWCFIPEKDETHYPLTAKDLHTWVLAIKSGKATPTSPPWQITSAWANPQRREQLAKQPVDLNGQPQWNLAGRMPKAAQYSMMPTFHVNINNNSNNGSTTASPWTEPSFEPQLPQLPTWPSASTASNRSTSGRPRHAFDLPIRSSSPPVPPAAQERNIELLREFVRHFARTHATGASNEPARRALAKLHTRLVTEGHSIRDIPRLPDGFFTTCELPGALVSLFRGAVKGFLYEDIEIHGLTQGGSLQPASQFEGQENSDPFFAGKSNSYYTLDSYY